MYVFVLFWSDDVFCAFLYRLQVSSFLSVGCLSLLELVLVIVSFTGIKRTSNFYLQNYGQLMNLE